MASFPSYNDFEHFFPNRLIIHFSNEIVATCGALWQGVK